MLANSPNMADTSDTKSWKFSWAKNIESKIWHLEFLEGDFQSSRFLRVWIYVSWTELSTCQWATKVSVIDAFIIKEKYLKIFEKPENFNILFSFSQTWEVSFQ